MGGPPGRSGLTELREGMVRKVLVTGATGRIGSQLVPRLAGYNDLALRAFVRHTKKAAPLLASGAELMLGHLDARHRDQQRGFGERLTLAVRRCRGAAQFLAAAE